MGVDASGALRLGKLVRTRSTPHVSSWQIDRECPGAGDLEDGTGKAQFDGWQEFVWRTPHHAPHRRRDSGLRRAVSAAEGEGSACAAQPVPQRYALDAANIQVDQLPPVPSIVGPMGSDHCPWRVYHSRRILIGRLRIARIDDHSEADRQLSFRDTQGIRHWITFRGCAAMRDQAKIPGVGKRGCDRIQANGC